MSGAAAAAAEGKEVSVQDAANYPLGVQWRFWMRCRDAKMKKGKESTHDWQRDMLPVGSTAVRSIGAFWDRIGEALSQDGASLFMFCDGVQPAWEDPQFATGSSVNFNLSGHDFNESSRALFTLACCLLVGGHFDPKLVKGAALSSKASTSRVEIWCTSDETAVMSAVADRVCRAIARLHHEFFPTLLTKVYHEGKPFKGGERRMRPEEVSLEKLVHDNYST